MLWGRYSAQTRIVRRGHTGKLGEGGKWKILKGWIAEMDEEQKRNLTRAIRAPSMLVLLQDEALRLKAICAAACSEVTPPAGGGIASCPDLTTINSAPTSCPPTTPNHKCRLTAGPNWMAITTDLRNYVFYHSPLTFFFAFSLPNFKC